MPLGSLTPAATVEEVMKASSIGLPSALDARYELWRPWPARQLASCKTLAIRYSMSHSVITSAPDRENCVWIGSLYGWFTRGKGRANRSVSRRSCAQAFLGP